MRIDPNKVRFLSDRGNDPGQQSGARRLEGKYAAWTDEEKEFLRRSAGKLNDAQIGERINRKASSVRMMASKLKISLRVVK